MHDAKNEDLVVLHEVHDPVSAVSDQRTCAIWQFFLSALDG